MTYIEPTSLRDALNQYYDEAELRDLCFELNIEYESLGGRGKADNVQELVRYALRQNRYQDLVAYVQRTRAHAHLRTTDTLPRPPQAMAQPGAEGTTHIYQAPVYQGDIGNLATEGGTVTDSGKKIDLKADNIIGNIGDGDFHNVGNIAMGDINIGGQPVPQTQAEFSKQLAEVQALLSQAVSQSEFARERDGQKAVDVAQEVAAEMAEAEPDKITITKRLEELKERLEGTAGVVEAAGKTGKAILKATPIVSALIKLAQVVF